MPGAGVSPVIDAPVESCPSTSRRTTASPRVSTVASPGGLPAGPVHAAVVVSRTSSSARRGNIELTYG